MYVGPAVLSLRPGFLELEKCTIWLIFWKDFSLMNGTVFKVIFKTILYIFK